MGNIEPSVRSQIERKIAQIEHDFKVDVILAVESGSRAWGFESPDSDYDVRFIYRHELKWYLNVLPKREVIELPIERVDDYSGWDVRKSLFLMNKSNPVLFEWLKSPIVYKRNHLRVDLLAEAAKCYYSPISSIYHYLHMAKGNNRDYLRGDLVKIKKCFYVLRPLLACSWIKERGESPPVEFETLLTLVSDQRLLGKIYGLLGRKRSGDELSLEPAIPEIREFIEQKLVEFETDLTGYDSKKKPSADYLDAVFYELVK